MKKILMFLFVYILVMVTSIAFAADPIVIDHTSTDICKIPESSINQAKSNLHIAYGHTSPGSQLTTGMTGLVDFANNGGLGLSLPEGIFAWNNGGTGGALDLHDYAMEGDCGYYPQWVNETKEYLDDPSHSDVNVIIWSWCGQVDDKYTAGTLDSEYLTPMSQLEAEYPGVTFVYMTGHVDHWDDANNKAANQMIRDYCINNNKVLYDFADIESYDPDGTFYEFPHDNCDYYESVSGPKLGNWAIEWQDSHTEGVDWYDCPSAHSQPLNANRKAYAVWWLWARLSGWNQPIPDLKANGSDGPLELTPGGTLSVTIALDPGDYSGDPADWWVVARTPMGWYHKTVSGPWQPGLEVTHQGPLFTLNPREILHTSSLPSGLYTFRFGVDLDMNGKINMNLMHSDSVVVSITP